MDARRLRLDPFAFALGALFLLAVGFFNSRNGGAVIMCALSFGGLIAARLAGFSNRALVPLTIGLVVLLWMLWLHPPPLSSHQSSALAHGTGGLLVGWAMAEYLRHRVAWPYWAVIAVGAVFGISVLWEIGEFLGDRAFDTSLIPSKRDSAVDITFGTLGASVGVFIATLIPARRNSQ